VATGVSQSILQKLDAVADVNLLVPAFGCFSCGVNSLEAEVEDDSVGVNGVEEVEDLWAVPGDVGLDLRLELPALGGEYPPVPLLEVGVWSWWPHS